VSVVSLIERGAYGTPGAPLVERLADALGYTVEELLGDTGYEPPPDGRAGRETPALRSPEAARLIEPGQVHPLMAQLRLARQQTCSQVEAARRMGNSMQGVAINNWEYGIHQPSLSLFVELARALGFKVVLEPLKEDE
jgi:transcriptional regulator with XRE-family HTH domain